ncbi:membrane hypothetical protein [uncultured delta proteobacterium]|uniref:Uncharacterized protein n=1 Tax=uncultured delta proteobacterium TaxID=34034 RepID=A0A212J3X3_9DELT|nr:membrane hypothetical protein [uncultured delta proteobacterium]
MFNTKTDCNRIPAAVSIFRMVHGLLFLYAAAILGITFFLHASATSGMTPERFFAVAVAAPMLVGSFAFWLATTVRVLFVPGIFFCSLLALVLACMPIMMNVFFPAHLVLFGLAAVYGVSCIILAQYFFAQPVVKRK